MGKSRGGFGTKIHLLTDGKGLPLYFLLTAGHRHEIRFFRTLIYKYLRWWWPDKTPKWVAGDKAYSRKGPRNYLQNKGIIPIIPQLKGFRRSNKGFSKKIYRRRNVIERCIGWLKECRALATRYEKLAINFAGTIWLAFIHRYLTKVDSFNRT